MALLESHVGQAHGKALSEEYKRCSFCDAAFDTTAELETLTKVHKCYSCEICFAGFMSNATLVRHKEQDHPVKPEVSQVIDRPDRGQVTPEDQDMIITGVTDPKLEEAMRLINVPDPDLFLDRLDNRVGLEVPDRNHMVRCEECGRFLKLKSYRRTHVMCFHPLVSYQCPYHPNKVFYTKESLIFHCQKVHVLCDLCEIMLFDDAALENHYRRKHLKSPPQKLVPAEPMAASSPIPADKPEEEQLEPDEGDQAKQDLPEPKPAVSKVTDRPVHDPVGRYICSICKVVCDTLISYKIHLVQHRKVPCKYCHRKFINTDSLEVHVAEMHRNKKQPQYKCKASDCDKCFTTHVESLAHLRFNHRSQFKFRCKRCMDCFTNLEDLFYHGAVHDQ